MSIPCWNNIYKKSDESQSMACRGAVSFWSIESEGNEGRGYRLRSVGHAMKAVVPSWHTLTGTCKYVECPHSRGGSLSNRTSRSMPCLPYLAFCLIQPLSIYHFWHLMEEIPLYSVVNSCKNSGWLKSPQKNPEGRIIGSVKIHFVLTIYQGDRNHGVSISNKRISLP